MDYLELTEYLKNNHNERENSITSHKLREIFGICGEDVRRLVNQARKEGYPICAYRHGYFYSEKPADVLETVNSLNKRIEGIQRAVNGLILIQCMKGAKN